MYLLLTQVHNYKSGGNDFDISKLWHPDVSSMVLKPLFNLLWQNVKWAATWLAGTHRLPLLPLLLCKQGGHLGLHESVYLIHQQFLPFFLRFDMKVFEILSENSQLLRREWLSSMSQWLVSLQQGHICKSGKFDGTGQGSTKKLQRPQGIHVHLANSLDSINHDKPLTIFRWVHALPLKMSPHLATSPWCQSPPKRQYLMHQGMPLSMKRSCTPPYDNALGEYDIIWVQT